MKNEILNESKNEYELTIWKNGKRFDSCSKIKISDEINTISKLKEVILLSNNKINITPDKIRLFNQKGFELEDADLKLLKESPLIYISYDNKDFSYLNYYYEYKIIKPIKSGGFAEVYLAENILNKKLVAIKKTDIKYFSTDEIYNLTREGRLLSNLNHPNIIKIYCYYTYENYLYNVMEYAKGGELTQYINSTKDIPEEKIKSIFKQIYDAVKYIHNKNIIHRDLKTNNVVFLDQEKTKVAIIDFGISSTFSGGDVLNAGTLKYLPPETFQENNKNSIKIDMWALGVILYILYFKKFPYDGKNSTEIKNKILFEPVSYPKNVKVRKTLMNLINKLLDKNSDDRISTADESFSNYFNDNDTKSSAFIFSRQISKSLKENYKAEKLNDIMQLIEKLKTNNDK
jgi:serine/threonine protein kinase